jgi:aryl-alcohol dehydrogenase-like predicted oxidoreductase
MTFPFTRSKTSATPARAAVAKLGLSTAGFGLQGDCAPARKAACEAEMQATVALAVEAGVRLIDTAPSHGSAETLIGALISARSPVRLATRTASLALGVDQIEQRALGSLDRFAVPSAGTLLVQAADLLGDEGPELWDALRRLKDEAYFDAIGIDIHPGDDALGLARRFKPDVIQAPVSLLDQGLIASGALATVAAMGIEVRLDSPLLQGLLFTPREGLPARFAGAGPRLSRIRLMLAEAGIDPLQAALAFALGRPEASCVVVQIGSSAELKAVIAAASAPAPQLDWSAFALECSGPLGAEGRSRRSAA